MITFPTQKNVHSNKVLLKWFTYNLLKANLEKLHLLTTSTQETQINIGGMAISYSKCEKLLDIHTDNKLTFEPHVRSVCKNASQKLNAFARTSYSLNLSKETSS